jgi:hypothetical protein
LGRGGENRAIKQIIRKRGGDPRNEYAVIEAQREMDRIADEAVATTKASRRLKAKKERDKQGAIHPTLSMNSKNHPTPQPSKQQRVVNSETDDTGFRSETTQDDSDTPGITPLITANGYSTKYRTRRK